MRFPIRLGLCLLGIVVTSNGFINHNEAYEVGITWNFVTGELQLQRGGVYVTTPWTLVARVDTRPQRVCITSVAHAAMNCKLVQFEPGAWRQFVAVEGWHYYWLANRFSFNSGYQEEYRGMRDILRGYAFSAQPYPFMVVLRDFKQD